METTLIILKPDTVQRGLCGRVISRFEEKGLKIVGMKMMQIDGDLAGLARSALPGGYRTPLTLRYRLPRLEGNPAESDTEYRFKLYIPRKALSTGHSAVAALAASTALAFREILNSQELRPFLAPEEP